MNSFIILMMAWATWGFVNFTQEPIPLAETYGKAITAEDLRENLTILASDAMEGRGTGTRGQKMAAAFIRTHFEEVGLSGPVGGEFYQPIDLYTWVPGEIFVKTQNTRLNNFAELVYTGSDDSGGEVSLPLVFVGNATPADFEQLEVKGKGVLLFSADGWLGSNTGIALARERGAKMIFVCNPNSNETYERQVESVKETKKGGLSLSRPDSYPSQRPGIFIVSPKAVDKLLGVPVDKLKAAADDPQKKSLRKIKPETITYRTSMTVKVVKSENVLGYLEGTDKKDEVLIITAHYDHIGRKDYGTGDLINNGADDDGSGTVAVMEMAKIFMAAKKDGNGPKRSILFMTVTGEENGLLGSDYYTQHPVFPLRQTVVDLNIDMIGRRDALHKDSEPYIYVIGADKLSTELNTVSEEVNNRSTKLSFDYMYNDQRHPDRLYYRSDHWNFAKNDIPVIFYFDGIHEDYHKPSDEVDKIEFDLLARRTQCIFYTAWEIANRPNRILPDKVR